MDQPVIEYQDLIDDLDEMIEYQQTYADMVEGEDGV